MSSATMLSHVEAGRPGGIGNLLSRCGEDLQWLAYFLTGDNVIAEACVVDAWGNMGPENTSSDIHFLRCARISTICSSIETQQSRIDQLASSRTRGLCGHSDHPVLSADDIDFVAEESDVFLAKLDVLCRYALVICGIERYSAREAGLLLGVCPKTVEEAYCFALRCLDVISCEELRRLSDAAAICN